MNDHRTSNRQNDRLGRHAFEVEVRASVRKVAGLRRETTRNIHWPGRDGLGSDHPLRAAEFRRSPRHRRAIDRVSPDEPARGRRAVSVRVF